MVTPDVDVSTDGRVLKGVIYQLLTGLVDVDINAGLDDKWYDSSLEFDS